MANNARAFPRGDIVSKGEQQLKRNTYGICFASVAALIDLLVMDSRSVVRGEGSLSRNDSDGQMLQEAFLGPLPATRNYMRDPSRLGGMCCRDA